EAGGRHLRIRPLPWQRSIRIPERRVARQASLSQEPASSRAPPCRSATRKESPRSVRVPGLWPQRRLTRRQLHHVTAVVHGAARSFPAQFADLQVIGDAVALSQSLSGLGNLAMHRGNFDEAKALYHEALELHHEQGNTRGAARTLLMLGNLAGNQADFTAARRCYEESLELSRRIEDQSGIALVFQNLGVITARQEHLEEAMDWYEKSLALRRELNDLPGLAATLETLGTTARKRGDTAAASRYYDESLALRRQMQDRPGTMLLRLNLALAAIDRSDPDDAANQVREALSLMRESGNDRYIPYVLETYASVCVLRGDEERAVRLWGASETLRAAIHAPGSASEIAERIAQRDDAARKMPPEKFAAALEAGRALTREEALALISG
ncbi:MAG: tetratricopeptide repeat protein, partial [Armatimonadota bacterium]